MNVVSSIIINKKGKLLRKRYLSKEKYNKG